MNERVRRGAMEKRNKREREKAKERGKIEKGMNSRKN